MEEAYLDNTGPSASIPGSASPPPSPSKLLQDPHPFSGPQIPFCLGFLEAK